MLQYTRDPEQRCLSPFFPGRPAGNSMTTTTNAPTTSVTSATSKTATATTVLSNLMASRNLAAAASSSASSTALAPARAPPPPPAEKMDATNNMSESEKINLLFRTIGFKNADERLDMIDTTFKDSYEWMFEQVTERRDSNASRGSQGSVSEQTAFTAWLSSKAARPLYWIGGVEGAGKSTLTKFLFQHDTTYSNLKKWADADKCRLFNVGHFFHSEGSSPLHKNFEGLLRSILFQVLSKSLELRFVLLRPYIDQVKSATGFRGSFWTVERLQEAFRTLLSQTTIPVKLCIFLDGLDETSELPDRITGFIEGTKSKNVKICAASRPWPAFQEYFRTAKAPGVQLHNFAPSEVLTYIMRKLAEIIRFRSLERGDPVQAEELRTAFVEQAGENVTWAKVAFKLIGKGLRDGASLGYLRKQIQELPQDIEKLYGVALDRVNEEYRRDAAVLFSLFREAQRNKLVKHSPNKGIQTFWALRHLMGDAPLESMKNHFRVEELDGVSSVYSPALRDLRLQTQHTFARLVESRTGGLLCVSDLNARGVVVLHKSVDDYLNTRSTRERLRSWLGPAQCNPAEAFNAIILDTLRHGPATTWLSFLNNTLRISFIQTLIPGEPVLDWYGFIEKAVDAAQDGWSRPRLRDMVKKETRLATDGLLPAYMVSLSGKPGLGRVGSSASISSTASGSSARGRDVSPAGVPLDVLACMQGLPSSSARVTAAAFVSAAYPGHLREFVNSKAKIGRGRLDRDELTAALAYAVLAAALCNGTTGTCATATATSRNGPDAHYANIQWLLELGADPSCSRVVGSGSAWTQVFNRVFRQTSRQNSATSITTATTTLPTSASATATMTSTSKAAAAGATEGSSGIARKPVASSGTAGGSAVSGVTSSNNKTTTATASNSSNNSKSNIGVNGIGISGVGLGISTGSSRSPTSRLLKVS